MKLALPLLMLAALCACDVPDEVIVDEGQVCVDPDAVATHETTGDLVFTVVLDECISACAQTETSCEAQLQGREIVVHSQGTWSDSGDPCIAVCGTLEAECVLHDVPPGQYTVTHGEDTWTLALPSQVETACQGGG
ncbi:MAG: hypothetical protein ACE37F_24100 [Nannocystaceae bacterium]|nr:hypothetical protein [bacterium]